MNYLWTSSMNFTICNFIVYLRVLGKSILVKYDLMAKQNNFSALIQVTIKMQHLFVKKTLHLWYNYQIAY